MPLSLCYSARAISEDLSNESVETALVLFKSILLAAFGITATLWIAHSISPITDAHFSKLPFLAQLVILRTTTMNTLKTIATWTDPLRDSTQSHRESFFYGQYAAAVLSVSLYWWLYPRHTMFLAIYNILLPTTLIPIIQFFDQHTPDYKSPIVLLFTGVELTLACLVWKAQQLFAIPMAFWADTTSSFWKSDPFACVYAHAILPATTALTAIGLAFETTRSRFDAWAIQKEQSRLLKRDELVWSEDCPLGPHQIRLIKILPKRPFQGPHLEIKCVAKDEAPPYEAISHRWEEPRASTGEQPPCTGEQPPCTGEQPPCTGEQPPSSGKQVAIGRRKRIRISNRLYDFLSHRQSYGSSRLIWIDAICIDQTKTDEKAMQTDADERATQILLMNEIFGNAARVIVWLGHPVHASDASLICRHFWLLRFGQWLASLRNLGPELRQALMVWCAWPTPQKASALQELLRNDWFGRIWMVQEIALAKEIHVLYGNVCLDWWELDHFSSISQDKNMSVALLGLTAENAAMNARSIKALRLIQRMSKLRERVQKDRRVFQVTQNTTLPTTKSNFLKDIHLLIERQASEPLALEEVLSSTVGFEATDTVDRILGLLGMISDPLARERLPKPTHKCYREACFDAVKGMVRTGRYGWHTLGIAGVGLRKTGLSRKLDGLPSWVPDYLSTVAAAGQIIRFRNLEDYTECSYVEDSVALRLKVQLHDCLEVLGPLYEAQSLDTMLLKDCKRHTKEDNKENNKEEKKEDYKRYTKETSSWVINTKSFVVTNRENHMLAFDQTSFWRTLFTDRYADESPMTAEVLASMTDVEHRLRVFSQGDVPNDPDDTSFSSMDDTHIVAHSLIQTSLGRRFALTSQGNYALVPPDAKVGDDICVFEGLPEPFLLRATDAGQWQLVGACFVDQFKVRGQRKEEIFTEVEIV